MFLKRTLLALIAHSTFKNLCVEIAAVTVYILPLKYYCFQRYCTNKNAFSTIPEHLQLKPSNKLLQYNIYIHRSKPESICFLSICYSLRCCFLIRLFAFASIYKIWCLLMYVEFPESKGLIDGRMKIKEIVWDRKCRMWCEG